jgi:rare lipoprotein A
MAMIVGIPILATLMLAGCEAARSGADGAPAARGASQAAQVVERDVERPDLFQMAEPGLWDGRPSLGGIWVAHPEATDPERVVIRHAESGANVTGALFRRERDNPGPRFQISSEAANALGILPGQPTTIRVTALRLEQVEVAPPPPASAGTEAEIPAAADEGAAPSAAPVATEPPRGWRRFFQTRRPTAASAPATPTETATDPSTAPASEAVAPPASRAATHGIARSRPCPPSAMRLTACAAEPCAHSALTPLAAAAQVPFETRAPNILVLDMNTGQVLIDRNSDVPLPPASMSKLMTLLMLFEAIEDGRVTMDTTWTSRSARMRWAARACSWSPPPPDDRGPDPRHRGAVGQ